MSFKEMDSMDTNTEAVANTPVDDDIIDIDLSATRKKRFRIDGDPNRVIELNTSDFSVISRLRDKYPELLELANNGSGDAKLDFSDDADDAEKLTVTGNFIDAIDQRMREGIDYIFASPVSAVCASDGTMYDLFNGKFRFEYIIEKLGALYNENVSREYKKMSKRLKKHTGKYTR